MQVTLRQDTYLLRFLYPRCPLVRVKSHFITDGLPSASPSLIEPMTKSVFINRIIISTFENSVSSLTSPTYMYHQYMNIQH
jgi:hypothetical protein